MTDVNEQIPSYSFSFLHAFFFLGFSCVTSFFLFFSRLFFFFFFFSSSIFGVRLFSFFFLGGAEFVLLVFGLFSLFLIFFFLSFRCWTFLLFLSGGCRICSSCFWPFFFFLELSCVASFFSFLFTPSLFFFFFFLLGLRCSSYFSVLDISLFLSGGGGVPNLFFLFLVSFPCFLYSGGLAFSLSLSPSIA